MNGFGNLVAAHLAVLLQMHLEIVRSHSGGLQDDIRDDPLPEMLIGVPDDRAGGNSRMSQDLSFNLFGVTERLLQKFDEAFLADRPRVFSRLPECGWAARSSRARQGSAGARNRSSKHYLRLPVRRRPNGGFGLGR